MTPAPDNTDSNTPSVAAKLLGASGLLPFVGLAALIWHAGAGQAPWAAAALTAYGASIVSFLGAIHWGLTMRDAQGPRTAPLVWGVVPSLLGWAALLLPPSLGLSLLTMTLWTCFAVDRSAYRQQGLQHWIALRGWLTLVASACCAIGAWAA